MQTRVPHLRDNFIVAKVDSHRTRLSYHSP